MLVVVGLSAGSSQYFRLHSHNQTQWKRFDMLSELHGQIWFLGNLRCRSIRPNYTNYFNLHVCLFFFFCFCFLFDGNFNGELSVHYCRKAYEILCVPPLRLRTQKKTNWKTQTVTASKQLTNDSNLFLRLCFNLCEEKKMRTDIGNEIQLGRISFNFLWISHNYLRRLIHVLAYFHL